MQVFHIKKCRNYKKKRKISEMYMDKSHSFCYNRFHKIIYLQESVP